MDKERIAGKLLSLSEKEGASQAEVFALTVKTSSVYIDDNIPKVADLKTEFGIGLKFVLGKQLGFTSSTLLSESPEDVVKRAKSVAHVSSEDPKFVSLPDPKVASGRMDRFFDKPTANAGSPELLEKVMMLVQAAAAKNVSVPNGVLRASSIDFAVHNSLGVRAGSMSTNVFGFFTAKAQDGGVVGEGVQRCWSRDLSKIDFPNLGNKLKSQAMSVLNATAFKENWTGIVAILAPSEGSEMVHQLVGSAASAENVNNRSSPWADKLGSQVAHKGLTVIDDGLSSAGLLSSVVDDEGVPTRKTTLIESGTLRSYIFDSYNAGVSGVSSTGNGLRRDPRDSLGRFSQPASCGVTTLEIPAGTKSLDEIIREVQKGVYIEHFAWPQVDPISGAFSNEARNACIIENGEITAQVKHCLLVGNMYESLTREVVASSDREVHDYCVIPTLAFSDLELVGQ
ncbi:MAG: hypothetical protein C4K49_08275 [Candidatus Thorarchaeota archaeon]|nr:MAG: hypothetical protein C4K49_08275 [Candidatus Thorarchaeota archaeon]